MGDQVVSEEGADVNWRAWYAVLLLMLVYASSFVDRTIIALLVARPSRFTRKLDAYDQYARR